MIEYKAQWPSPLDLHNLYIFQNVLFNTEDVRSACFKLVSGLSVFPKAQILEQLSF